MKTKQWHPDDLQKVFPEIPEDVSRTIMAAACSVKEEKEMKMRHTVSFALAFVLVFVAMMGIALAVFHPRIAEIFGSHYGEDFKEWLQEGDVAVPENSVVIEGVTFTLNEVAVRNHGLYGVGTITPGDGILLVCEDYPATEPFGYATFHGDKAPEGTPTVLEKAAAEGSAIKQVAFYLEKIGADDGALIMLDGWAMDARPMRDGSIQFLFEVEDGVAVDAEAETYTIELQAVVRNVSPEGDADYENPIRQMWTVKVEPQPFAEVTGDAPETAPSPAPANTDEAGIQPVEVIVPEAYEQNGTLLVYRAIPRNFEGKLNYEWFNQSGIASEDVNKRHIGAHVVFTDEAQLNWSEQTIFYNTYDGTYEATSEVFEGSTTRMITETLPKPTMTSEACSLAGWMTFGFPGTDEIYTLERTELTNITLDEAKNKAEELLSRLGLEGYACTTALDMSLERIRTMGAELNCQIDAGNLFTNNFRYDYDTATTDNEGYYLKYHRYGTDGDGAGLFEANFYVTADGVMEINLRDYYEQGEVVETPDQLLDANAVAAKLPEAMAASRHPETLLSINRATLTWIPVRSEKGQDMVFTPVWMLTYLSADGEQEGYEGWAAFSAIDGKLVDAIFN